MMNINTAAVDLRVHARRSAMRAFICLCCGLALTASAIADTQPAANELQIQTTPNQLLGEAQATLYKKILAPDAAVSWQIYLPKTDTTEKPGVFVYVSPMNTGRIDSRWREVMDQQNLIYIAANESGNVIPTIRRMVLATLAVKALARQHAFDPGRIFVSGFSGGGRVASLLASQYPKTFIGAVYICGVDFWKKDQTPDVERVIRNRFVFLTGSRDFNRTETRRAHKRYLKAGAQHSKLIIVPGMAHKHPDAAILTEAIRFLDGEE
jgi:hypothetical protein